jgi:ribonuclease J
VLLIEDGDVLILDSTSANKTGKVTTGRVCIDNNSTADVVEDTVIRDRKHLGEDGVFLPIIAINKRTGMVEGLPEIATRGFAADDPDLMRNARDVVVRTLELSSEEERRDYGVMKDKIRGDLKRFLQKNANRRPLIMPIILEL